MATRANQAVLFGKVDVNTKFICRLCLLEHSNPRNVGSREKIIIKECLPDILLDLTEEVPQLCSHCTKTINNFYNLIQISIQNQKKLLAFWLLTKTCGTKVSLKKYIESKAINLHLNADEVNASPKKLYILQNGVFKPYVHSLSPYMFPKPINTKKKNKELVFTVNNDLFLVPETVTDDLPEFLVVPCPQSEKKSVADTNGGNKVVLPVSNEINDEVATVATIENTEEEIPPTLLEETLEPPEEPTPDIANIPPENDEESPKIDVIDLINSIPEIEDCEDVPEFVEIRTYPTSEKNPNKVLNSDKPYDEVNTSNFEEHMPTESTADPINLNLTTTANEEPPPKKRRRKRKNDDISIDDDIPLSKLISKNEDENVSTRITRRMQRSPSKPVHPVRGRKKRTKFLDFKPPEDEPSPKLEDSVVDNQTSDDLLTVTREEPVPDPPIPRLLMKRIRKLSNKTMDKGKKKYKLKENRLNSIGGTAEEFNHLLDVTNEETVPYVMQGQNNNLISPSRPMVSVLRPSIWQGRNLPEYERLHKIKSKAAVRASRIALCFSNIIQHQYDSNGYFLNDHDYLKAPYKRNDLIRFDISGEAIMYCQFCNRYHLLKKHFTHMKIHANIDMACHNHPKKENFKNCFEFNEHMSTHQQHCKICDTQLSAKDFKKHVDYHIKTNTHNRMGKVNNYRNRGMFSCDKCTKVMWMTKKEMESHLANCMGASSVDTNEALPFVISEVCSVLEEEPPIQKTEDPSSSNTEAEEMFQNADDSDFKILGVCTVTGDSQEPEPEPVVQNDLPELVAIGTDDLICDESLETNANKMKRKRKQQFE